MLIGLKIGGAVYAYILGVALVQCARGGGVGRVRLRAALGNADHCRPQHALADRVAGLHDLHDGVVRHVGVRALRTLPGGNSDRTSGRPAPACARRDAQAPTAWNARSSPRLRSASSDRRRRLREPRPAWLRARGADCRRPPACRGRSRQRNRTWHPSLRARCGGADCPFRRQAADTGRAARHFRPLAIRPDPARKALRACASPTSREARSASVRRFCVRSVLRCFVRHDGLRH